MPAFHVQKLVRFQHCDPAGIIFFPQYFVLFNEVFEDWFTTGIGVDFRRFHVHDKLGCPLKKTNTEFFAPSMIGDLLDCHLTVLRLGTSSLDLEIRITCGGELRAVDLETRIHSSTEKHRSHPFSATLRERIVQFEA